jgi:cobalt-zinc-cadmium resistance protein CzcA
LLEVKAAKNYLLSRWLELQQEWKKQKTGLDYYEKTGLQQATLITRNASIAYNQGQISYLEWTLLMNNAVNIELSYLQAVQQYNNTVIELNYLTGK